MSLYCVMSRHFHLQPEPTWEGWDPSSSRSNLPLVRCTTLAYAENVGSQFLSLRQFFCGQNSPLRGYGRLREIGRAHVGGSGRKMQSILSVIAVIGVGSIVAAFIGWRVAISNHRQYWINALSEDALVGGSAGPVLGAAWKAGWVRA